MRPSPIGIPWPSRRPSPPPSPNPPRHAESAKPPADLTKITMYGISSLPARRSRWPAHLVRAGPRHPLVSPSTPPNRRIPMHITSRSQTNSPLGARASCPPQSYGVPWSEKPKVQNKASRPNRCVSCTPCKTNFTMGNLGNLQPAQPGLQCPSRPQTKRTPPVPPPSGRPFHQFCSTKPPAQLAAHPARPTKRTLIWVICRPPDRSLTVAARWGRGRGCDGRPLPGCR
jgi:hypothetical protein